MKIDGMNLKSGYIATDSERTYATWMHLSGLSGYVVPFGNVLVPLILWALKFRESQYIHEQGVEVMNFQLTIAFYSIFTAILVMIIIGWVFVPVVFLLHLIGTIMGAVKTWEGESFRYPVTFRVIRAA